MPLAFRPLRSNSSTRTLHSDAEGQTGQDEDQARQGATKQPHLLAYLSDRTLITFGHLGDSCIA
jgi:hypothetical protein